MKLSEREEAILTVLWRMKKAFVKEIIEELGETPPPPYNTISSIIRRMADKGVVGFEAFGKTHRYYPILKKEQHKQKKTKQLFENYFGNSFEELVSYFVKNKMATDEEIEDILKQIKASENE